VHLGDVKPCHGAARRVPQIKAQLRELLVGEVGPASGSLSPRSSIQR
jgi:hypothetical protein